LLEIKASCAAPHLPVDVLDVIARHVFAMLGELDGEPMIWALMLPRKIALDDEASLEFKAAHLGRVSGSRYLRGSSLVMSLMLFPESRCV